MSEALGYAAPLRATDSTVDIAGEAVVDGTKVKPDDLLLDLDGAVPDLVTHQTHAGQISVCVIPLDPDLATIEFKVCGELRSDCPVVSPGEHQVEQVRSVSRSASAWGAARS